MTKTVQQRSAEEIGLFLAEEKIQYTTHQYDDTIEIRASNATFIITRFTGIEFPKGRGMKHQDIAYYMLKYSDLVSKVNVAMATGKNFKKHEQYKETSTEERLTVVYYRSKKEQHILEIVITKKFKNRKR